MEKKVPIRAMKPRPTICWRMKSRASRLFSRSNLAVEVFWRPKVLVSSTPLTDSVSSTSALRSATVFWVSLLMLRRMLPTRVVSRMNSGTRQSESTVSAGDNSHIATTVVSRMATLLTMLVKVSVTTVCTPATSLERRAWISPV